MLQMLRSRRRSPSPALAGRLCSEIVLPQMLPVFSLVAPCQRGVSPRLGATPAIHHGLPAFQILGTQLKSDVMTSFTGVSLPLTVRATCSLPPVGEALVSKLRMQKSE